MACNCFSLKKGFFQEKVKMPEWNIGADTDFVLGNCKHAKSYCSFAKKCLFLSGPAAISMNFILSKIWWFHYFPPKNTNPNLPHLLLVWVKNMSKTRRVMLQKNIPAERIKMKSSGYNPKLPDSFPIPQKLEISKTSLLCIRNKWFREREKTRPRTYNNPVVKALIWDLSYSNSNILTVCWRCLLLSKARSYLGSGKCRSKWMHSCKKLWFDDSGWKVFLQKFSAHSWEFSITLKVKQTTSTKKPRALQGPRAAL